MKRITLKLLKQLGACSDGIKAFEKLLDGRKWMELSPKNIAHAFELQDRSLDPTAEAWWADIDTAWLLAKLRYSGEIFWDDSCKGVHEIWTDGMWDCHRVTSGVSLGCQGCREFSHKGGK